MKILHVKKITSEKWLNLFVADWENRGHTGHWIYASRNEHAQQSPPNGDAVLIVPVLKEDGQPPRLVLIHEFRVPAGGYVYGLPAGLLEPGESIEDTARRELLEETGLELLRIKRITPPLLSSSGLTDETACMVFVDVKPGSGEAPALEGSEDIEVVLLDHAGICRLCDDSTLRIDAKAWMVLYMFQQLGRVE
jgi:ADP-ribose pyrophosphatase